jgi:hypothetical protein
MNVPEAIPEENGGRNAREDKDQRISEHRGLVRGILAKFQATDSLSGRSSMSLSLVNYKLTIKRPGTSAVSRTPLINQSGGAKRRGRAREPWFPRADQTALTSLVH